MAGGWSFTIPLDLKSANRSGGNRGRNPRARQAFRQARYVSRVFATDARIRMGIPRATGKRRVSFTRICGPRQHMFDQINWASACKPVLDSLVSSGLLVDDSRTWVDDVYPPDRTDMRDCGPAVIVTITED